MKDRSGIIMIEQEMCQIFPPVKIDINSDRYEKWEEIINH